MVTKIGGKIFYFFPFIFLINFSCQENKSNKSEEITVKHKNVINKVNIKVLFIEKGSFSLNTVVNHRNHDIEILGNNGGIQQSSYVQFDKPTVLENYRFINNKIVVQRYFAFVPNDSLSFEFRKDSTAFIGNQRNNILNHLIKDDNILTFDKPKNIRTYIDELETVYKNNTIKLQKHKEKYNKSEFEAINKYLKLYFYYKLFNVEFVKNDNDKQINKLDNYYNEICDNINIFSDINTIISKRLLYNLIRFVTFKNNGEDISVGLTKLDNKFHKTGLLDGFLLDYLNNEDIQDSNQLNKLKSFLSNQTLTNSKNDLYLKKDIPNSVLNSLILDSQSVNTSFKDIIETQENEKLVLIDLWATWCLPCIKEMPEWEIAEAKYKNVVKFVRISIDTDNRKWLKFLATKEKKSQNYIITNSNHEFIKYFEVNSIPRFILIDRDNKVISDNFVRPSDSQFYKTLDIYIK